MIRRIVRLAVFLVLAQTTYAQEKVDPKLAKMEKDIAWYDAKSIGVEGKGFADTKSFYDRLPARAEGNVREGAWKLSRDSAGMNVHFVTDATSIQARWTLTKARLALPHMPSTGVSGVDLYVKTDKGWRWLGIGIPRDITTTARVANGLPSGTHEFMLYLPLYNGVSSLEIGIPPGKFIAKAPAFPKELKPIVFYGTSIQQGGCASRPGLAPTSIVARRIGYPIINLAFSGNGRMDVEIGKLLGEIDASVYVIDCLGNMGAKDVTERAEPLVRVLREARADTPILLVAESNNTNAHSLPSLMMNNVKNREALKGAYDRLTKAGVKGLHYLSGDGMTGDDDEGTVDGQHPNDIGFMRQAEGYEKALRGILKK